MRIGKSDDEKINQELEWHRSNINILTKLRDEYIKVYGPIGWSVGILKTLIVSNEDRIGQILAQQYLKENGGS